MFTEIHGNHPQITKHVMLAWATILQQVPYCWTHTVHTMGIYGQFSELHHVKPNNPDDPCMEYLLTFIP